MDTDIGVGHRVDHRRRRACTAGVILEGRAAICDGNLQVNPGVDGGAVAEGVVGRVGVGAIHPDGNRVGNRGRAGGPRIGDRNRKGDDPAGAGGHITQGQGAFAARRNRPVNRSNRDGSARR